MAPIPFPLSSSPGLDQQESAGRLINAYAEKTDPGSPNPVIWRRVPGLLEILDITGRAHCRGMIYVGNVLVVVLDERVFAVTAGSGTSFSVLDLGAFAGTGMLTIARNHAATTNIVAVDANSTTKNLFLSSAPTDFVDTDLGSPNSVSEYKNYLTFTYGDGTIRVTGINDVSIATDAFTTAPGPLVRGVSFRGEFFAFGSDFIQPYRDVGASPFPFEPSISGGGVIPRGIVGTHAVAGWEPGWSNELIWVGDDNVVYRLDGYSAVRVSKHAVERAIQETTDRSDIRLSVAMASGHAFLIMKAPGEWTWVYDLTTGEWHERKSYGTEDFRGSCSVKAFDRWVMGDETTGKLGEFTESHFQEFGDPLVFRMQSGVPATFPSRGIVSRADFDFTTGTGVATGDDPIETDPVAQIRWSTDGGGTWKNPITRKLGAQGKRDRQVSIAQGCGLFKAQGIRFEVAVSDPVHCALRGAQMQIQALG